MAGWTGVGKDKIRWDGTLCATNLCGDGTLITGLAAAVDWTLDQSPAVINAANYTDTTYVSSDFTHDDLTGVDANEHIDWTGATQNFSTTGTGTIASIDVGAATHNSVVVNGVTKTFDFSTHGDDVADKYVSYMDRASNNHSPTMIIARAKGTHASPAQVADGDILGQIGFMGWDGTDNDLNFGAYIRAVVDGTAGNDDLPTELVFGTCADGDATPTQRMAIDESGKVGINVINPTEILDVDGNIKVSGTVDGVDVATRDGLLTANVASTAINTGKISYTDAALVAANVASTAINTAKVSYTDAALVSAAVASQALITTDVAANTASCAVIQTNTTNISANTASCALVDPHIADSTDPHTALLTQTNITVSAVASAARIVSTADETTASLAYVRNVVIGVDATPPTASNFTRGTLYVQYTA